MSHRMKTLSQFHQLQPSLCLETISPPVGPTCSVLMTLMILLFSRVDAFDEVCLVVNRLDLCTRSDERCNQVHTNYALQAVSCPFGLRGSCVGLANSVGSNIFLWNCLADTTSIQVAHNLLTPSNHVYGYAKPAFHLG